MKTTRIAAANAATMTHISSFPNTFFTIWINLSAISAIVAGVITQLAVIFIGDFNFNLPVSAGSMIFGIVASVVIALIYQFFVFAVDYTRTEYLQYEDDDYYYYVKAVPKLTVSAPDVKVQRIYSRKNVRHEKNETRE